MSESRARVVVYLWASRSVLESFPFNFDGLSRLFSLGWCIQRVPRGAWEGQSSVCRRLDVVFRSPSV
eukprot:2176669-Pyramimonas_sp.AAC.1